MPPVIGMSNTGRGLSVLNHSICLVVNAALSVIVFAQMADAADQQTVQEWQDQETWAQFTDKEHHNNFKMTTPKTGSRRPQEASNSSSDQPVSPLPSNLGPAGPGSAPVSNFSVPAYIVMPGQAPAMQQPMQRVESVITPIVRQQGYGFPFSPFGGGFWNHRYGGGPAIVGYRNSTRVVQTGPSKSSGNYYMPSTPDPRASGNFYASPTPAPVAMPVINKEPDSRDYWGRTGNQLPQDMQPQ